MSFLVSFKGQFSSMVLPDYLHRDENIRLHRTGRILPLKRHHEDEGFPFDKKKKEAHLSRVDHINSFKKVNKGVIGHQKIEFAHELMSSPVKFMKVDNSTAEAIDYMNKAKIKHLPLFDEDILSGIVSDRDLFPFVDKDQQRQLREVMTPSVLVALEKTPLKDIAKVMLLENISALPIIDDKQEVVGILTKSDILRSVVESSPLGLYV